MKNRKIIYGIIIVTVILGLFVRHYVHEERVRQREIEAERFRIERSLELLDYNLGRVLTIDPLYSTWDINNRQDNSTSIIRLASIYYALGIEADEVEEIWLNQDHELHRDLRSHLTNVDNPDREHVAFERELRQIIVANRDKFPEIPDRYFEVGEVIPLARLSLESIEFLLEQKGFTFD